MLTSLFTGVSGMNAHMDELSVIGHNIANMNTYGFKGSRSYFCRSSLPEPGRDLRAEPDRGRRGNERRDQDLHTGCVRNHGKPS